MARIIKLSLKQLQESEGESFVYLDADNNKPEYDGQLHTSVEGNMDGGEIPEPTTGDKYGHIMTRQRDYWFNNNRSNGNYRMYEDKEDDFFKSDELDVLDNGNTDDDITAIPETVLGKLANLFNEVDNANLNSKKRTILAHTILKRLHLENIPFRYRKNLIQLINGK